ncbi:MAG: TolC family protein [Bacteroidia bacterium]|nr:TolC family protein [Bacteroidia bacterium]
MSRSAFGWVGVGVWLVVGLCPWLHAQTDTLTLDTFLARVARYHPVAQVGRSFVDLAAAELRIARGGFDPVLAGSFNEKVFKDQLYYNKRGLELKAPLGGLADISGGYERNTGEFINPESSTTGGSLVYAGVTVPLLRGLITDDRRVALQQARLLPQLGSAERLKLVNKLLLDAGKAYWLWWLAGENLRVQTQGVALAEFRLRAVATSIANGDRAPIDSVEALNEVRLRQVQQIEAQLLADNARLALETFLWAPDLAPAQLGPQTLPTLAHATPEYPLDSLANFALANHPELRAQRIKLEQLGFELTLARQNLLPQLDATYKPYLLSQGNSSALAENYRLGLSLYFPLFLRKERGKLQATRVKVSQQESVLTDLVRDRLVGLQAADNSFLALNQIQAAQADQLRQSQTLLQGETTMFQNGESSLFLINQRERAVLSAQTKLLEVQAKRNQSVLERLFAAGWPLAPLPD